MWLERDSTAAEVFSCGEKNVSLRSAEREEIMRAIETEAQRAPTSGVAEWPDAAELGDELLPVPAFGLELLPPSLRGLVEDISERMQAPPDYAAAATIVALAGCVNRRAVIIPKQEDKSWHVVPNLWGGNCGASWDDEVAHFARGDAAPGANRGQVAGRIRKCIRRV